MLALAVLLEARGLGLHVPPGPARGEEPDDGRERSGLSDAQSDSDAIGCYHPELVSPSVILYENWTMQRHMGIRGTRYLFPPLRRITSHAPDTSQRVERFQHDSSG